MCTVNVSSCQRVSRCVLSKCLEVRLALCLTLGVELVTLRLQAAEVLGLFSHDNLRRGARGRRDDAAQSASEPQSAPV
jgi:hypothetical protein